MFVPSENTIILAVIGSCGMLASLVVLSYAFVVRKAI